MKLQKILVVGPEIPEPLKRTLSKVKAKVSHVLDGNTAIARAQQEFFDAALLISTGEEMDLAETIFNLSDVSGATELIILSDQTNTATSAISKELLAELVSSASIMTTQDLQSHLSARNAVYKINGRISYGK
jgi:DNA-binding response OmpR family regulator